MARLAWSDEPDYACLKFNQDAIVPESPFLATSQTSWVESVKAKLKDSQTAMTEDDIDIAGDNLFLFTKDERKIIVDKYKNRLKIVGKKRKPSFSEVLSKVTKV